MTAHTNVIDLTLHRNRKKAQHLGKLMWAMYSGQTAGIQEQWAQALKAIDTSRQA